MRRVVGTEHVDDALLDAAPDAVAVLGRAHRRIHLRQGAEPLVAFGRYQRQMMWRRFARRHVLVIPQKLDLLPGRDVQHMNALSALAGELDQPLRRHQRGGLVAPERMRAWITFDAQALAFIEAILILGVKRGAAADHLEDPAQACIVLDQTARRSRSR